MYFIPLIVIVLLALVAVAWNPIFALVIFALFMLGYFAFVGLSRRSDEQVAPASHASDPATTKAESREHGVWGEKGEE